MARWRFLRVSQALFGTFLLRAHHVSFTTHTQVRVTTATTDRVQNNLTTRVQCTWLHRSCTCQYNNSCACLDRSCTHVATCAWCTCHPNNRVRVLTDHVHTLRRVRDVRVTSDRCTGPDSNTGVCAGSKPRCIPAHQHTLRPHQHNPHGEQEPHAQLDGDIQGVLAYQGEQVGLSLIRLGCAFVARTGLVFNVGLWG